MARTTDEILALVQAGFTPAQIVEMEREGSAETGAASTVAAPPKAKAVTPAWIVQRAINSEARKRLAAEMRAKGVEPKGAAWTKAKKAAGIA